MGNAWAKPFQDLLNQEEIRSLSRLIPHELEGLDSTEVEVACKRMTQSFENLFIPTQQTDSLLLALVGIALAHATTVYSDSKRFLAGVYSENGVPLPEFAEVICLTGLSGSGKSSISKALQRILGVRRHSVHVGAGHGQIPLTLGWFFKVRKNASIAQVLAALAADGSYGKDEYGTPDALWAMSGGDPRRKESAGQLFEILRRRAFISGTSVITPDEFQFITRSEANATVTAMLMHLAAIGPPLVFVANYSLVHRLEKRPQEERARLLRRPMILHPDAWDSDDWLNTVKGYFEVAPGVFTLKPGALARTLHGWTEGIKRYLGDLLILAYRKARERNKAEVGEDELRWAYASTEYSKNREDVRLLAQQRVTGKMARKDLWCPFDLPAQIVLTEKANAKDERMAQTQLAMVLAQLTPEERLAYDQYESAAMKPRSSASKRVIGIRSKAAVTADELRRGEELLHGS